MDPAGNLLNDAAVCLCAGGSRPDEYIAGGYVNPAPNGNQHSHGDTHAHRDSCAQRDADCDTHAYGHLSG